MIPVVVVCFYILYLCYIYAVLINHVLDFMQLCGLVGSRDYDVAR